LPKVEEEVVIGAEAGGEERGGERAKLRTKSRGAGGRINESVHSESSDDPKIYATGVSELQTENGDWVESLLAMDSRGRNQACYHANLTAADRKSLADEARKYKRKHTQKRWYQRSVLQKEGEDLGEPTKPSFGSQTRKYSTTYQELQAGEMYGA
jgi:hypothetical protein